MLVANARHAPLSEAVAETFDGAHPCGLCHVVAAGKKSEKKSDVLPAIVKMDLICTLRTLTWLPPWGSYEYPRMQLRTSRAVAIAARASSARTPGITDAR